MDAHNKEMVERQHRQEILRAQIDGVSLFHFIFLLHFLTDSLYRLTRMNLEIGVDHLVEVSFSIFNTRKFFVNFYFSFFILFKLFSILRQVDFLSDFSK